MTNTLIKGLSHIAIAVRSLKDVEKWISLLPTHGVSSYRSEEQKVNALVVSLGEFDLEFLEPIGNQSSVTSFLEKNPKGGIHHICFYVEDLEASLSEAKERGVRSITRQKALGVIHNSPISFLNPKDLAGVLIEFEELPRE